MSYQRTAKECDPLPLSIYIKSIFSAIPELSKIVCIFTCKNTCERNCTSQISNVCFVLHTESWEVCCLKS